MGDVVGLVEKAAEAIEEKDAMRMMERISSGEFDFTDFLDQMTFMKRLGPLESISVCFPACRKMKDLKVPRQEDETHRSDRPLDDPQERRKPDIINFSAGQRIAAVPAPRSATSTSSSKR